MGTSLNSPSTRWRNGSCTSSACSARSPTLACPRAESLDEFARQGQLRGERLIHRHLPERGGVSRAVIDGGEGERLNVGGRNNHDPVDLPALEQRIGVGRHAARVDVSGVRSDQGHDVLDLRHRRLRQESVHHLSQFLGIGRIERAGHRRRPHLGRLRLAGGLERKQEHCHEEQSMLSCIHPHTPAMGCWQYRHFPLLSWTALTRKPSRSTTTRRHLGQYVFSAGWPGTLPT